MGKWETVAQKWRIEKIKRKWHLFLPGEEYEIDLASYTKENKLKLTLKKMPHGREAIYTKVYQATL